MDADLYRSNRPFREVRAVFDDRTVRVYQAFPEAIASAAVEHQRFVSPFRLRGVMSWIKPSFLWVMRRTAWGRYCRIGSRGRPEAEHCTRVLAIDVERAFFERCLTDGVLSHREERAELDASAWRTFSRNSDVLIQWDPERDLAGECRPYKTIQIGLRRSALQAYVNDAVLRITDETETIRAVTDAPTLDERIALLPPEQPFPIEPGETRVRLGMD